MAFFRKWKTHYKHKKFTSDEAIDVEDWGLPKPVSKPGQTNVDNLKLDLNAVLADDEIDGNHDDDDDSALDVDKPLFASYNIKYLGCTPIETKRSEKIVSEAIKTVIANSKAGGRKNKSQKRVIVNVSQDGIEVLDELTQDSLMRFSIYKISYCSVDAAHDHAFSFVGSETDPLSEQEKMSCHVFQCPKRKVAHEITLMVARCFEHAYQHWRDTVVQHSRSQETAAEKLNDKKTIIHNGNGNVNGNGNILKEHNVEVHQQPPLIDLAADVEVRKFLQNSWISFEDDSSPREGDVQRIAAY